jgi:hypothetical protein
VLGVIVLKVCYQLLDISFVHGEVCIGCFCALADHFNLMLGIFQLGLETIVLAPQFLYFSPCFAKFV